MSDLRELVERRGDGCRRSRVDDDVVYVAVDDVLDSERAVLVRVACYRIAVKAPVSVALDIELTGGAALDADLGVGVLLVEDSGDIVSGLARVKGGVVSLDDQLLGCRVVGFREGDLLFTVSSYGKTRHSDVALVLTDREADSVEIHVVDDEFHAELVS